MIDRRRERSSAPWTVERQDIVDTLEEEDRRREVEERGAGDPDDRSRPCGWGAHRRKGRAALEREEEELAALNPTGGDPEDVFVDEPRDDECGQGRARDSAESARRCKAVFGQKLLGWAIPAPPEI